MPLEPNDLQHLQTAIGYCELAMFQDANDELEEIDAEVRHVPEVLAVRLHIYRKLKQWDLMQVVAKRLVKYDPDGVDAIISLAYATSRAEGIPAARIVLESALVSHPEEASILYNLACYACQMGEIERAKELIAWAFELDSSLQRTALEDEDLRVLRESFE